MAEIFELVDEVGEVHVDIGGGGVFGLQGHNGC